MGFLKKAVRGFGKAIFGGRKGSAAPAGRGFAQTVARAVKTATDAGATGTSSGAGMSGVAGKASELAEGIAKPGLKKGGMVSKRSSGSARGQGAVMKKKRAPKMC